MNEPLDPGPIVEPIETRANLTRQDVEQIIDSTFNRLEEVVIAAVNMVRHVPEDVATAPTTVPAAVESGAGEVIDLPVPQREPEPSAPKRKRYV